MDAFAWCAGSGKNPCECIDGKDNMCLNCRVSDIERPFCPLNAPLADQVQSSTLLMWHNWLVFYGFREPLQVDSNNQVIWPEGLGWFDEREMKNTTAVPKHDKIHI